MKRDPLTGDPVHDDPLPNSLVNDFFDHLRDTLEDAGKLNRQKVFLEDGTVVTAPDERFEWFRARCKQRLAKGAREYGNRNFLRPSVHLPDEFIQEMLDGGNYGLMELVKNSPDECAKVPLGMAVYHAVLAAFYMADYENKMRGSF